MDAFEDDAAGSGAASPMSGRDTAGCAALLLTESLMHALVANGTISRDEFVDIVDGAADVEHELAMADAVLPNSRRESVLRPLAHAFKLELGE